MKDFIEFKNEVCNRIEGFQFPEWVDTDCPSCRKVVYRKDIMGMEVHFVPMFLGDISFSYFCPHCNASFVKHVKCDVCSITDVENILFSDSNFELEDRDSLIQTGKHNLRSKVWNPISTIKTQRCSTTMKVSPPKIDQ